MIPNANLHDFDPLAGSSDKITAEFAGKPPALQIRLGWAGFLDGEGRGTLADPAAGHGGQLEFTIGGGGHGLGGAAPGGAGLMVLSQTRAASASGAWGNSLMMRRRSAMAPSI